MQILQNDIFGKQHNAAPEKEKKKPLAATPKTFRDVTITDGLDETSAAADAMLIHRILQKKIMYAGLSTAKQKEIFIRILENEMNTKAGKADIVMAARDSLLAFFGR